MTATPTTRARRATVTVLLEFLGSMNLAITLLVAVAIASVIGTVLKQNEPYNDYLIKFGPFWFEVYKSLQLYDVYHASWFLFLLAFLVLSTSFCIYRKAPVMLRDMRQFREHVTEKSLRAMHLTAAWRASQAPQALIPAVTDLLRRHGFRVVRREADDHNLLAAKKGGANRLGYIFTHTAIVVICIGGLFDGNLPLMLGELTGNVVVETRNVPVNRVAPASVLAAGNPSFRGNVSVPEGQTADFVFLNVRDGFLVQRLPFAVEVKEFRIEHYDTGQPKSFESDLLIHDPDRPEPVAHTIAVNHPLTYKGITIYQASFADGGSELELAAHSLTDPGARAKTLKSAVNQEVAAETAEGRLTVEFTDFRMFNIHNLAEQPGERRLRNLGPSFQFKLRSPDGRAREFQNYMQPVPVEGRLFFLSGKRASAAEDFRYLHIPLGPDGGLTRFLRLHARVVDERAVEKAAARIADTTLSVRKQPDPKLRGEIVASTVELVRRFRNGGFPAIEERVTERIAAEKREEATRTYFNIIRLALGLLYEDVLRQEGAAAGAAFSEEQERFFEDAVTALAGLYAYDSPFLLQLTGFKHIEATGLQMTRSPGKTVVYLGCTLLIAGVFLLFYVHPRRVWIYLKPADAGSEVLIGGSDVRNSPDFVKEFARIEAGLKAVP